MSVFRGSGVALVTPFHEDKSVNFEMLEYLVERQITNETDAIVVCGTTGEPATMSEKERLAVIKTVVAKTSHRIPVIAGVGCNATERTISFVEKVNDLGVDGMLIVTPYYNKATQNGLHEHYRQIAAHTPKPIIIYNVPGEWQHFSGRKAGVSGWRSSGYLFRKRRSDCFGDVAWRQWRNLGFGQFVAEKYS